eukprot:CAMPEP_0197034130 /NCGR_PEP_ID=MMETSP1384-20130603/12325_1 /TAXON_ID=29189 /ORGANISM="Ammonia sp." /LENGTH=579 /DNA_ID=CAMNT_0042464015 /DNA_START=91 /DNA_END=1830 /DNA_ORIENTATION=+
MRGSLALCWLWCLFQAAFSINKYRPPVRSIEEFRSLGDAVPGINYLSRGYNIFFGNPHTTGNVDEGLAEAIFDLTNVSKNTYDGHSVPYGVSIVGASSCVEEFTYNAVTGANSYSKSLTSDTSFEAKGFGAAFSASVDYQSVYKTTSEKKTMYTSTNTKCSNYAANLNLPYDLPAFTSNFYSTVENMPNNYNASNSANKQWFFNFFTKYFGTHYITKITMGGIFGTLSEMETFSYSSYSSSNLEISTSASYSCLSYSAGVSSMNSDQKTEASYFNNITIDNEIYNIGGNLPDDTNQETLWSEWQSSLAAHPAPIYYAWEVIPNLLTKQYFPKIGSIESKQHALQSALDEYCSELAADKTYGTIECSGYPPDPSVPGKSIIQGAYSDNLDDEPGNPYANGGHSCNEGYKAIQYGSGWSGYNGHDDNFKQFYCVNETMNKHDELDYFGGLYENCATDDFTNVECNIGNYFMDGKCECPSGYKAQQMSDSWTSSFQSSCWHDGGWTAVFVWMCYNPNVHLSNTIIGGSYAGPSQIPNQYTGTYSCPSGFTAYKISTQCDYSTDGDCHETQSTYICLSNIYPV